MFEGLATVPEATLLPFVRHGRDAWILKAKGGEQATLDAHALQFGDARSFEGGPSAFQISEAIFRFLDDVCVVCLPDRVQTVVSILATELWNHAYIQVHDGKTQVSNRAGQEPIDLTARARIQDPNAVV